MTHYPAHVICKDRDELEDMLAPYSEYLEVEEYKEYWADNEVLHQSTQWGHDLTNKQFVKEYFFKYGEKIYEDEKGIYELSTRNPVGYWDYWSVGGRWSGLFSIKPGVPDNEVIWPNYDSWDSLKKPFRNWDLVADGAMKKHIDWEDMAMRQFEDSCTYWSEFQANPSMFVWEEEAKHNLMMFIKEEYARTTIGFYPYKLVDSDGWHQQGKTVMFAGHIDEMDDNEWDAWTKQRIDKMLDDEWLIQIDCHT